jgi:hypothetical protein
MPIEETSGAFTLKHLSTRTGGMQMKSSITPWNAAIFIMLLSVPCVFAQNLTDPESVTASLAAEAVRTFNSSSSADTNATSAPASFVTLPPSTVIKPKTFHPFSAIGFDSHTGLAGTGFDIATPLARKFNLRAGADFFSYATAFQQQGANIGINLRMKTGRTSLDWFPFGGRFRLSPLLVANNNRILATALIPSGSTISLNGNDYISSLTDPLHGNGRIDFRRVSLGLTLGFGNIIPRTRNRLSIPIELGFYYVGQPNLQVNFIGSACDPAFPASVGCQSVSQDPAFQKNLAAFIARNNNNLSYASFFPIFSIGFGYAF